MRGIREVEVADLRTGRTDRARQGAEQRITVGPHAVGGFEHLRMAGGRLAAHLVGSRDGLIAGAATVAATRIASTAFGATASAAAAISTAASGGQGGNQQQGCRSTGDLHKRWHGLAPRS